MKGDTTKKAGWALILIGALAVLFSRWIVFSGLVWLVGLETIAGKNNIAYTPDGGYHLINPKPATYWVLSVIVIGVVVWLVGCWMLFQRRKAARQPGN
jgi:hypothetical protein